MNRKHPHKYLALAGVASLLLSPLALAQQANVLPIKKVYVDGNKQIIVEFAKKDGVFPTVPRLLDLPGPNHRVVMDFSDAVLDKSSLPGSVELSGEVSGAIPKVKAVRYGELTNAAKPTARIVFDLPTDVVAKPSVVKLEESTITISLGEAVSGAEANVATSEPAQQGATTPDSAMIASETAALNKGAENVETVKGIVDKEIANLEKTGQVSDSTASGAEASAPVQAAETNTESVPAAAAPAPAPAPVASSEAGTTVPSESSWDWSANNGDSNGTKANADKPAAEAVAADAPATTAAVANAPAAVTSNTADAPAAEATASAVETNTADVSVPNNTESAPVPVASAEPTAETPVANADTELRPATNGAPAQAEAATEAPQQVASDATGSDDAKKANAPEQLSWEQPAAPADEQKVAVSEAAKQVAEAKAAPANPVVDSKTAKAESVKRYNEAVQFHLAGKLNDAIAAYKAAIQFDPALAEAHSNLGLIYNQQHNYAMALSEFRKALAIQPKDAITYNGIGAALRAQRDLEGAIKNWETAVSYDPQLATAHYNLGTAYEIEKQYDKAMESYQQAVNNDYRLGEAYYRMGLIAERKKQRQVAIKNFRDAVKASGTAEYSEDARQRLNFLSQQAGAGKKVASKEENRTD